MPKKYRLTATHDYNTESPNSYGAFVVRSFSTRHVDNVDPEVFMEKDCPTCNGYGYIDDDTPQPEDCQACEGIGTVPCNLMEHPDVVATLSYYEHGLCKWMVGESTVPDYGGFDTVGVAGVLTWHPTEAVERDWFYKVTEEEQRKILDDVVAYYTAWANGECYGYSLDELEQCGECLNVEIGENIDSCWGFIGDEEFNYHLNTEAMHGINPADVEVVGEAEYVVELKQVEPA